MYFYGIAGTQANVSHRQYQTRHKWVIALTKSTFVSNELSIIIWKSILYLKVIKGRAKVGKTWKKLYTTRLSSEVRQAETYLRKRGLEQL